MNRPIEPRDLEALLPLRVADDDRVEDLLDRVLMAACELINFSVRLYTPKQVGELLSMSPRRIKREIAAGRLRVTHSFGERTNRISMEEVRRFRELHRVSQ